MNEKVDILLTTYNTKIKFLKEQIDSILKQTYSNFNLIISDDASSDKEVKKTLKQYERQDKRIILYLQEKNLGYNKNFEFLLKKSTEEYIMFSDHDDIWYPEKVEKCLKKITENNLDLVYCNASQIDESGNVINKDYFKYKNMPLVNGKSKVAISRYIGIGCSQIITKRVRDKMLPFKEEVIAHDWLASFIANELNGMSYIEESLFGYRLHGSNVFGGRSFAQNVSKWKEENGDSYESYLKYRNEKVIKKAYLDGAEMCLKYSENLYNQRFLNDLISYYNSLLKSKYVNFHMMGYFDFLSGNNLLKKMVKEFVIFQLPCLGYLVFRR